MTKEEITREIEKYDFELMDLDNEIYTLKARQNKIKLLQDALQVLLSLHVSPS